MHQYCSHVKKEIVVFHKTYIMLMEGLDAVSRFILRSKGSTANSRSGIELEVKYILFRTNISIKSLQRRGNPRRFLRRPKILWSRLVFLLYFFSKILSYLVAEWCGNVYHLWQRDTSTFSSFSFSSSSMLLSRTLLIITTAAVQFSTKARSHSGSSSVDP